MDISAIGKMSFALNESLMYISTPPPLPTVRSLLKHVYPGTSIILVEIFLCNQVSLIQRKSILDSDNNIPISSCLENKIRMFKLPQKIPLGFTLGSQTTLAWLAVWNNKVCLCLVSAYVWSGLTLARTAVLCQPTLSAKWSRVLVRPGLLSSAVPASVNLSTTQVGFCKPWRWLCVKIPVDQQFLKYSDQSSGTNNHSTFKVS